jgi:hypothetical protein
VRGDEEPTYRLLMAANAPHRTRIEEDMRRPLSTCLSRQEHDVTYPSLAHRCSILRSAWKGDSRKLVCSILHTPVPQGRRTANGSGPPLAAELYILWWYIKMRCSEWEAAGEGLAGTTQLLPRHTLPAIYSVLGLLPHRDKIAASQRGGCEGNHSFTMACSGSSGGEGERVSRAGQLLGTTTATTEKSSTSVWLWRRGRWRVG